MGYQGVSGNSVAIEFDTFNNAGYAGVINNDGNSSNHVSIDTNGNLMNTGLTNVYGNGSCGFASGDSGPESQYGGRVHVERRFVDRQHQLWSGANLTVILSDPAESSTFTAIGSYPINLASLLALEHRVRWLHCGHRGRLGEPRHR